MKAVKIIGLIATLVGGLWAWYLHSVSVSDEPFGGNPGVVKAEECIAEHSLGGTEYDLSNKDPCFVPSVKILFAYYERSSWQARWWIVFKWIYDEKVSCSIIKHAKVFLDGKGGKDFGGDDANKMWTVVGEPFLVGYKNTRAYVDSMKDDLGDCPDNWRMDWKNKHPTQQ